MLDDIKIIDSYWRATNYLSVVQLYLKDNFLLETPLKNSDVKSPILGHWGAIPGVNFILSHLNRLLCKKNLFTSLILGSGHACVSLLTHTYLEGSLQKVYPSMTLDLQGIKVLANNFSLEGAFQTEISPHIPNVVYAGGELGPALSVAQGIALKNPGIIVCCILGDGECETGGISSSWQGRNFFNHKCDGIVFPIINMNGFKMGSKSILSTMLKGDIEKFFLSQGYEAFVTGTSHESMICYLEKIHDRWEKVKLGKNKLLPALIVKTPKGWTGPTEGVDAHKAYRYKNDAELCLLHDWLLSYSPRELFHCDGSPRDIILRNIPKNKLEQNPSFSYQQLKLPKTDDFFTSKQENPANMLCKFIEKILEINDNFMIFSPDELSSNKFDDIFKVSNRKFFSEGNIVEVLNEQLCHGMLQGFIQSKRHGILTMYEGFASTVSSMLCQYVKFLKQSKNIEWRNNDDIAGLNYFITSLGWNNCYTHQNSDFITTLMQRDPELTNVYMPADANSALIASKIALESKRCVNGLFFSKTSLPTWFSPKEAEQNIMRGFSIWVEEKSPDVVIAACGDCMTIEVFEGYKILLNSSPYIKVRLVYISQPLKLLPKNVYKFGMSEMQFSEIFSNEVPIIFSFLGYPSTLQGILFHWNYKRKMKVLGYLETPQNTDFFGKMSANKTSRFHVATTCYEMLSQLATKKSLQTT